MNPFKPGEVATIKTEDGEIRELTAAETKDCSECALEALDSSISDLININDLNEMAILHNLRIRYKEDTIYTNISTILISVNPFKLLPLYTPEVLEHYRYGGLDKKPHIFSIAYNAYNSMRTDHRDQSVVCSGESGAGKSEATKLILQFLTDASGKISENGSRIESDQNSSSLEQQILAANPILEAFGNAKTLRNNNSSRFGKLITVNFDRSGSIMGGNIINYLLEKSRIVFQSKGERNYHIFYQLLSTVESNPSLAETMQLSDPELFEYTNKSGVIHIENVSDEKDFEDFISSMDILNFQKEEQNTILRVVAGVLHFGNVKFKPKQIANAGDGSQIANQDSLEIACKLWECDKEAMDTCLTHRLVGTRDAILVPYSVIEAQNARDAMVKRVYAELFQYVIDRINHTLSNSVNTKKRQNFIGVLDIFGFETFTINSFEQLCINYCNEKLQYHFNEHIFKMEQTVYASEGIIIDGANFVDNQPTLDLLELKGSGIFSMCDEEINIPKGSDEGFLNKVLKNHAQHSNMQKPKPKDCIEFSKCFGVKHYAGTVFYQVTNFLEKNKDELHTDIQKVLRTTSKCKLIVDMIPPPPEPSNAPRGKKSAQKTLGGQFKQQLQDLIQTLNSTFPHFVRCMKPNDDKASNNFDAGRMQDQLRYAGLVEVCRIRKLGYPVRRSFDEFYKRYRCCEPAASEFDKLLVSLIDQGVLKEGEWAVGHTKIFMRTAQSFQLELAREAAFLRVVVSVQREARRYIYRRKYLEYVKLITAVDDAVGVRDDMLSKGKQIPHLDLLNNALEMIIELPWGGSHLEVVRVAKGMQARVKDEIRIMSLLEGALIAKEINALRNAVTAASSLAPPFKPIYYDQAVKMIKRLEDELEIKHKLIKAMEHKRNWGNRKVINDMRILVKEVMSKAESIQYDCDELRQATILLERISSEEKALIKLDAELEIISLDTKYDKNGLQEQINTIENLMDDIVYMGDGMVEASEMKDALCVVERLKENMKVIIDKELLEKKKREQEMDKNEREKMAEEAEALRKVELEKTMAKKKSLEAKQRERCEEESKIKQSILEAEEKKDIQKLNEAIREAMQQGLNDDNLLERANVLRNRLQLYDEVRTKLLAACNIPRMENGISKTALTNLNEVIAFAEKIQQNSSFPFEWLQEDLQAAKKKESEGKIYMEIQDEVSLALKSKDRLSLKKALSKAENLDMNDANIAKAKTMYKEAEIMNGNDLTNQNDQSVEDYDRGEQARQERRDKAQQGRFELKHFSGLRSPDHFAKGIIKFKAKVKESMLMWTYNVIPRSLTDLPKDLNKMALQLFKDLQGYMGDRQMPFPAMLAQDILRKGSDFKALRDEIFIQIIKQISFNPRSESQAKGWQMLCMCLITFPPTVNFENFLLHFLLKKYEKGRGAVKDYARYCIRSLEGMLVSGEGTNFVPSVEEIQAYKERPPILATIELVDGNIITEDLPITPDLSVEKVLKICTGWLDLKDQRADSFGIFVYDMGDVRLKRDDDDDDDDGCDVYSIIHTSLNELPRTPRPLKNDDYMGDVVVLKSRQKRGFKFVMKKKIYLQEDNYRGDDDLYERLIYLQAEDEAIIKGNLKIEDESTSVMLTAISYAVAHAKDFPADIESMLDSDVNLLDFCVPTWKETKESYEWASLIFEKRDEFMHMDVRDLQEKFVAICSQLFTYGTHWFYVRNLSDGKGSVLQSLPRELLIGFNVQGMHCFTFDRTYVATFTYANICKWGGNVSQFSIEIYDDLVAEAVNLTVATTQSVDMAASILDHIRFIMAARGDVKDQHTDAYDSESERLNRRKKQLSGY